MYFNAVAGPSRDEHAAENVVYNHLGCRNTEADYSQD